MIYNLRQVKTNFDMQWIIQDAANNIVCNAACPLKIGKFEVFMRYPDNINYTLYYNPLDTSYGGKIKDRLSFKIINENKELTGRLVGATQKTGKFFWQGYQYYDISFGNKNYAGYEVGLGTDGIALCLYENDTIVATIIKNPRVVNFRDEYKMYVLSEEYLKIASMFVVYYDALKFANLGEIKLYSETYTVLLTHNKELKSKYDPNFINRMINSAS